MTRLGAGRARARQLIRVEVECYAGARADEAPLRFRLEGRLIEVSQVLDRWHEVERKPGWPRADYYVVQGADGREYLLKHDLESDEWSLEPAVFEAVPSARSRPNGS